jgi:AcrR family transcriptional regulator
VEVVATTDRRRLRGEKTRQAILTLAAQLASSEGLEAVSLQRLAGELGISKSGLFAHFGSKEELQLATVEEAGRIITDEVLRPALKTPAGLGRIWAMCNSYLSYLERGVFSGGCFFEATAAEFDSKPGPVRDKVLEGRDYWAKSLARATRDAQSAGEVQAGVDPEQLAWELGCLLVGANSSFLIDRLPVAFERARRAVRDRLERAATDEAAPLA